MREFVAAIWTLWSIYLVWRYFMPRPEKEDDGNWATLASAAFSLLTAYFVLT